MERKSGAFDQSDVDAIITIASGCGAMLHDYPQFDTTPSSSAFAKRVKDIGQFLAELVWPNDIELTHWRLKVAYTHPAR